MPLTVDASVVIKWFVKEQGFAEIREFLIHGSTYTFPTSLLAEFSNTTWQRVHRRSSIAPATSRGVHRANSCTLERPSRIAASSPLNNPALRGGQSTPVLVASSISSTYWARVHSATVLPRKPGQGARSRSQSIQRTSTPRTFRIGSKWRVRMCDPGKAESSSSGCSRVSRCSLQGT